VPHKAEGNRQKGKIQAGSTAKTVSKNKKSSTANEKSKRIVSKNLKLRSWG
jgi:hypothetical protein